MLKNEYIAKEELKSIRLDKVITDLDKELSRMAVQRLIEEGGIKVNRENRKSLIQSASSAIKLKFKKILQKRQK
jgi:RNA-binding protein YlmH